MTESKKEFLNSLSKDIAFYESKIDDLLKHLNWNLEDLREQLDRSPTAPQAQNKSRQCQEQEKEPPSSLFFYRHAPAVISFSKDAKLVQSDQSSLNQVHHFPVPTSEVIDRLSDYASTIEASKKVRNDRERFEIHQGIDDMVEKMEAMKETQQAYAKSEIEKLAEQRDRRRRRRSYRKIRITKRTPLEIHRDLIHALTEEFAHSSRHPSSDPPKD
ncbi:uncharacterized protein VTP21DRAFT_6784 [Calcarisporiella thermophila]|uniref:uncharacterized protein n=1 Tax=Calcarisporiella thermophila TaxID=911321 RepID=UPI0037423FD4